MTRFRMPLTLFVAVMLAVLPACGGPAPSPTAAPPSKPPAAPTAAPAAPTSAPAAPAAPTAAPAAAAAPTSAAAPTKVYEYNVSASAGFNSQYADISKEADGGRKIAIGWWNDTKGKEIGVKLNMKTWDHRFDPSVVASMWPGILASDKPITLLGMGGPDTAALQQRLPTDKVPMFTAGAGYGFGWLPSQWLFYPRPTYTHEVAGLLSYLVSTWKESRPLRVGWLTSQASSSYVDTLKGVQQYVGTALKGKAEFVGVEYSDPAPADLSNQVKSLLDKGADYMYVGTSTVQVAAALKALEKYASKAHLFANRNSGIAQLTGAGVATLQQLEGYYDVSAQTSGLDTSVQGYKLFNDLKAKYATADLPFTANTLFGMGSTILAARVIERAVKAVGADKLTGEAIYNATFNTELSSEELLGVLPNVKYTKEQPFPSGALKVTITTAKDGKHIDPVPGWFPIPNDVTKW